MSDVVKSYYDENAEMEWERLVQDAYHRLEYIVTMYFLEKYLPEKGMILDAGGGPGRYTIDLVKMDYDVVLFDLSPRSLEVARREIKKAGLEGRVKKIVEGSITDLSEFGEGSFDAVLCLGPLSHLLEEDDRNKAITELIRVAKKDAPIFASVISLYGVYRVVLKRLTDELLNPSHEEMFTKGIHREDWHVDVSRRGFTDAKFFHPTEVRELFEDQGTETLEMATCEGLSSQLVEETNNLYEDKKKWERWLEIVLRTCNDPHILGLGEHFLYIGRKI
ncbi:MAG: class I SAM-dependent methyltransferase [Candidatus Bathyarchaeia archaeon]